MGRIQCTEALLRFREVLLASGLQDPTTQLMSYHQAKAVALMNTNPQEAMRWVRLVAVEGHPWGVQELDGTVVGGPG